MNDELRHGYTLTDLHALTRLAVHTAGQMATDYEERYDIAWAALAELLYSADEWMPHHDLVHAGRVAIYDSVKDDRHTHGVYKHQTFGNQYGPASSPAFRTFWLDSNVHGSPENGIVEHHALDEIMPMLAPRHQRALFALAVYEDYFAAADALGITYESFKAAICLARREFFALWHEGETPSKPWGCDRRAGTKAGTRRKGGTATDALRRRAKAAA